MILRYLKPKEWGLAAFCAILIAAQVWLELEIPGYMSSITQIMVGGGTTAEVMDEGWKMIACSLASVILSFIVGYVASYVAASLGKRLRKMEFEKVQSYSMDEINKFSTASLVTRSTNDITQVQLIIAMGLQVIIKAPIMAVWAMYKISDKSPEWSIATAVAIAVILCCIIVMMFFVVPRFKKIQWMTDDVNRVMREGVTGIRVIKAYNAEDYQEEKFERTNDDLTSTNLFTGRAMSMMMPVMTITLNALSLSIYWIGAYLVNEASGMARMVVFSDMVVFLSYAMQIVMAFMMTVMIFILLPRAAVAAKRIEEVIDTETTIQDGTVSASPDDVKGEVVFENVSFRYPGASDYILEDISFKAERGETVAFVGSTGSGKSTLINLIPRFYDVTDGRILVDGVDVKDYTLEALHSKMGYVPQKGTLFKGTVTSNVAFGSQEGSVDANGVERAVEISQGKDFVERMDGAYGASISQGGTNVSGGQKQRLSIARAVYRSPEFYVFDDSFSALDYKTDRVLRSALKKETNNSTSFIVATRIGTILNADKIVVLDDGRIVGCGTHSELLRTCSVYRDIAESQLTKEELGQ